MNKYKQISLCLPLLFCSQLSLADWVDESVKNVETHTIKLRQYIHQNPELGNMEFKTSALVQKELKSYGIEVKTGYAKTGVIGILKGGKPGPVMALRADMDALPVEEKTGLSFASKAKGVYQGQETPVMHACGHDAHTAMLLGAAKTLAANKDKIAGTVVFVFQPAEEGGADIDNFKEGQLVGARKMISDGALNNPKPEVIFGMHVMAGMPSGNILYKDGAILNSADLLNIEVQGQQAHGSMPWLGRDPIYASSQIVNNLQSLISRRADLTQGMGVVSIGSIHGGTAGNVIPDKVNMVGTIRSNSEKIRQSILKDLPIMIEHNALANDVTAKVDISSYAPVTSNGKVITQLMQPTLAKVNGEAKLQLLDNNASASEDFAYYGQIMPSLFVFVGATPPNQDMATAAPNHNPMFIVDDATLKTGVESHVRFILDYPKVAEQVQADWKKMQAAKK
ncbi:N-acyl-L-amino acid amidohydrolase [Acinetobacter sp. SFB]|uniref:amidohydrolase n=1 Tax=Acinetobacter sp. SFB TaxID=1805634 RepID=UPI0007D85F96|nr:amidohydrolase [Acinetobacter sp. SFB]OAL81465.1 N-acyl-L-amino acid amidohydrolase [Acinetobacter sp. SFB]